MKIPYLAFRCDQLPLHALLISACAMGLTFVASQAFGATPVGLWYAEGGAAEVQVFPCADEFCGRVVGLRSPLGEDGCELRDDKNPDSALRNRAIIGLLVLTGLKPADDQTAWVRLAPLSAAQTHEIQVAVNKEVASINPAGTAATQVDRGEIGGCEIHLARYPASNERESKWYSCKRQVDLP